MKIFDREKRGQGATEYLLMLAAVLVVVAVAVTMLTDLAPDFEVTGQPAVTDYGSSSITVNMAGVSTAPADAQIQEISIVVDGNESELWTGDTDSTADGYENAQPFDNFNSVIMDSEDGASDRDAIGDIIIQADAGTATITPVFQ